jgi:hypothetical protein
LRIRFVGLFVGLLIGFELTAAKLIGIGHPHEFIYKDEPTDDFVGSFVLGLTQASADAHSVKERFFTSRSAGAA